MKLEKQPEAAPEAVPEAAPEAASDTVETSTVPVCRRLSGCICERDNLDKNICPWTK
jgi:hypothetical protein